MFSRQTSQDILSLKDHPVDIWQLWDFGCCRHLFLPVNKQSTLDGLAATSWVVATSASCSYIPQDSSSVGCASWLLLIPFWLDVDYTFFRTSQFFSISSSSPIRNLQVMAPQTHQPGDSGSESSRLMESSSNSLLADTQPPRRHQVVHRDNDNSATEYMTQEEYIHIIYRTGSSKNQKQQAIQSRYNHITVTCLD